MNVKVMRDLVELQNEGNRGKTIAADLDISRHLPSADTFGLMMPNV